MIFLKYTNIYCQTQSCNFLKSVFLLLISVSTTFQSNAQIGEAPYEIAHVRAPFDMPQFERPVFQDKTYDVRDYGAEEWSKDRNFKSTEAINLAIAAANKDGGGKVLIPKGKWLTGPIHLKSNINLHVAEGAMVYFSQDKEDYLPVVRQRFEGVEAYNYSPLIYAYKVENVAITGKGVLDGMGQHWWDTRKTQPRGLATKVPLSKREFGKGAGKEGMRPNFVVFWKSSNILVEGITLNDSPMWNVHLTYSQNVIVRDITVNSLHSPNGDGLVIDSSRDVLVEYNHFETGDDAVVLKSGFNQEGLEINIPTENIVVRNFEARKVRTGSGGVVFGSETSGGIRNVYVHDAYFEGSDRGIRFKTERGRGNIIENIFIRDVRMKNIKNDAISFNSFYSGPEATGPAPLMRDVFIRDIEIDGVQSAILMTGLPEKWLENITLENIKISNAEVGARITRVKNLKFKNVTIHSRARAMVAEDVYELTIENLKLNDNEEKVPLFLKGAFSGAIILNDFPIEKVEFGDGLSKKIVKETLDGQVW